MRYQSVCKGTYAIVKPNKVLLSCPFLALPGMSLAHSGGSWSMCDPIDRSALLMDFPISLSRLRTSSSVASTILDSGRTEDSDPGLAVAQSLSPRSRFSSDRIPASPDRALKRPSASGLEQVVPQVEDGVFPLGFLAFSWL